MTAATDTFKSLTAALASGSLEDVLACLEPAGTVVIQIGTQVTTLTGPDLHAEVQRFLAAFDSLSLTPLSRSLSGDSITEDAVVSGNHVGAWAGIEPSNRRVRFNVRLTAQPARAGALSQVWIEPDARALLSQLAGDDDLVAVTTGLIATVRERETRPVRVTSDTDKPSVATTAGRRRRPKTSALNRRNVAIAAVLLSVLAIAGWRLTLPGGSAADGSAAYVVANPPRQTPTTTKARPPTKPSTRPSAQPVARPSKKPVAKPTKKPLPAPPPVIATPKPKTAPKVQAGRQLVLSADVLFGQASSVVAPGARAALTKIAQDARRSKVRGTIQVNGYTDGIGTATANATLSRTRALAVARVLQPELAGLQIVLAPQGFGEANPLATNSTTAGQARNRRVTIVLPKP